MNRSIEMISGIGEFEASAEKLGDEKVRVFWRNEKEKDFGNDESSRKAFLIERKNTIEVRCDRRLSAVLREKYESVMESRYFGRGGIEIVDSGQLTEQEIEDLIRLSYNLT